MSKIDGVKNCKGLWSNYVDEWNVQVTFHVFILVWGQNFVRKFVEFSLPAQLMPGNLPTLGQDSNVVYHIYTDRRSGHALEAAIAILRGVVDVEIHYLEDLSDNNGRLVLMVAAPLKSPEYKYFLQKHCVRDCAKYASEGEDALILLDSNFVIADGGLGRLAASWKNGIRAIMVSVLRTNEAAFTNIWQQNHKSIASDKLFETARQYFHPLQKSYFVGSDAPTSYPIQVCWPVAGDQIYTRSFLPHPLMVPVRPAIGKYQSTMDYDLALRVCEDSEISICENSDEILICKFSEISHQAASSPGPALTPENLALFILTSTHHRHRQFSSVGIQFRGASGCGNWKEVESHAKKFIDRAYEEVDRIIALGAKLDARFFMYIKSYLGPIEDYMSPEIEPAELRNLMRQEILR